MSHREQQTARVNVDDATWQTFRIRSIQAGRSVADELGRLVRNDLRHTSPLEPPQPSAPEPTAAEAPGSSKPAPTRRAATTRARRRLPKQHLADLELLTELPYRAPPTSRPTGAVGEPPAR